MRMRIVNLLVTLSLAVTLTGLDAVSTDAKGGKAAAACPKKIGGFTLDDTRVGNGVVDCYYMTKNWNARDGWIRLDAFWRPDTPDERVQCDRRNPPRKPSSAGIIFRPDRAVHGSYSVTEGRRIKEAQAVAALRKLIKKVAPLGHPCIPEPEPVTADVLACPLVIGDTFVRRDWYGGDPAAVETGRREDGRTEYILECDYRYAYRDDNQSGNLSLDLRINWWEGDPDHPLVGQYCRARTTDGGSDTSIRDGIHPLEVRIDNEFASAGGQEVADRLTRLAAARTQLCPGASASELGPDAAAPEARTTTTTAIVLGGGPGDEPPVVGSMIPMPEDDQHRIVIGGLGGEVIREEFLGDQATIVGFGPMATDAEGNWSVSVDVEAGIASAPPSPAPSTGPPSPEPSAAPELSSAPSPPPAPTEEPTIAPAPVPSPSAAPTPASVMTPDPASSPTPVPPPEMVGVPEALDDYVAGLEPEAAGAVRNLTDYLGALGDEIATEGRGEVTIPASDLAELRRLVPGLVDEIKLVSGGIIVDSYIDVRVTPVIGKDGLIEFRTNHLQDRIRAHTIVKALVVALNNYVVESGGRFRTVSVTPEGLTVTAERRAEN